MTSRSLQMGKENVSVLACEPDELEHMDDCRLKWRSQPTSTSGRDMVCLTHLFSADTRPCTCTCQSWSWLLEQHCVSVYMCASGQLSVCLQSRWQQSFAWYECLSERHGDTEELALYFTGSVNTFVESLLSLVLVNVPHRISLF